MVNLKDDTKERFDALQPEDTTHDEFVRELLNAYEQHGKGVDPEQWADRVSENVAEVVANKVELGSYRGAKSALEDTDL